MPCSQKQRVALQLLPVAQKQGRQERQKLGWVSFGEITLFPDSLDSHIFLVAWFVSIILDNLDLHEGSFKVQMEVSIANLAEAPLLDTIPQRLLVETIFLSKSGFKHPRVCYRPRR